MIYSRDGRMERWNIGRMEYGRPGLKCIIPVFQHSNSQRIRYEHLQLVFNRQNADDVENKPVPYVGLRVFVVLHFLPVVLSSPH
jgi:hypothetical protein